MTPRETYCAAPRQLQRAMFLVSAAIAEGASRNQPHHQKRGEARNYSSEVWLASRQQNRFDDQRLRFGYAGNDKRQANTLTPWWVGRLCWDRTCDQGL